MKPVPFLVCWIALGICWAATGDNDFDVSGVRDVIDSAAPIYRLFDRPAHLQAAYPDSPHDFPPYARQQAYRFLDQHLQR